MKTQYWVKKRGQKIRVENLLTKTSYNIPYSYRFNNAYEVVVDHLRICGEIVDEHNSGWVDARGKYLITIKDE